MFLYDHPELIEQYPHGIVTPDLILISANDYEKVVLPREAFNTNKKSELKKAEKSYLNIEVNVWLQNMYVFIEKSFDISFSKDEKEKMSNKVYQDYEISKPAVLIDFASPHYMTKKELMEAIKPFKLNSEQHLENIKVDTKVISNILFKSRELHNIDNPLNKLSTKINNYKEQEILGNMTLQEFQNEYSQSFNKEPLINYLVNLSQEIINTSKTTKDIVDNLKKKWILSTELLEEIHFIEVVDNFKQQYVEKHGVMEPNIMMSLGEHFKEVDGNSAYRLHSITSALTDSERHIKDNKQKIYKIK